MSSSPDALTLSLTGVLPFILIVGVGLAAVASWLLLGAYRRAVMRSMRTHAPSASGAAPATPAAPAVAVTPPGGASAPRLLAEVTRAPWRTAAVYAGAGFAYAAVMAIALLLSTGMAVLPLRFLLVFWAHAWPVVLTVDRIAAATARARATVVAVYLLVLLLLGALGIARSPDFSWGQLALLWASANLLPTLLALGFLNRRVRAVGPLVLIFTVLAATGSVLVLSLLGRSEPLLFRIVDVGMALGLGAHEMLLVMAGVGFVLLGVVGGGVVVHWVRGAYERKRVSDQMIMVDSLWLIFALVQSVGLVFEAPLWFLAGPAAFAVYRTISAAGFHLLARSAPATGGAPKLLLLRVFALGRRSEHLFDLLGLHWRHVGSIRLIAGPDLATTTIEPHEFLDFLSRKLDRRFIDGPEALERRVAEMDPAPDPDGRFRAHDFFCYDNAWRMVLRRLVTDSDAVVMDLRGFSARNSGCLFEVQELIDVVPLERVVVVVDGTTDEAFLRASVERFWREMTPTSPNLGKHPGAFRTLRLTGSGSRELPGLLREISAAARPTALPGSVRAPLGADAPPA